MKKRPTIFTVLILTLFAMPSVGLMTSPANNMPIAAAVDYDSASGPGGGTTITREEQPQPEEGSSTTPQQADPNKAEGQPNISTSRLPGMVCTAEYNKQNPNNKVALATYDEQGKCTADAGKKKGMVCTAEYNKQNPNNKVALATYDEQGNCTADAGKKKGMVCTDAKEHHLLATYNDDGNCIVKSCVAGYKLDTANNKCVKNATSATESKDTRTDEEKAQALAEKQQAYDDAKATEQSTANKTLTALTTAATGIGAMELAQGLSEQTADKNAENSMAAYIQTMRCTYANGKQVKAGPDEIELPGGNNENLMKYRTEYLALVADLKERKTALGMKAGIESEEILDKAQMGLYDDENVGIDSGAYASLYRAQMFGSEADLAKIAEEQKTSKNRVIGGAVAAGVGVVGGILGNSLINGKLGEKIKEAKAKKDATKTENDALSKLQSCLKDGGAKNTNQLKFSKFTPSILHLENIDCSGADWKARVNGKKASELFIDSDDAETITKNLVSKFGDDIAYKLLDVTPESFNTSSQGGEIEQTEAQVRAGDPCPTEECFDTQNTATCKYVWVPSSFVCVADTCKDGYKIHGHGCEEKTNLDYSPKDACEKVEGGKWVEEGNAKTCVCPEQASEEFWDSVNQICAIEEEEEEEIPYATKYYKVDDDNEPWRVLMSNDYEVKFKTETEAKNFFEKTKQK